MPRRKSATALDADLTAALEGYYTQQAAYLKAHAFADTIGGDLKKMEIARMALESRTRASAGPDDALSAFYAQFAEDDDDALDRRTIQETAELERAFQADPSETGEDVEEDEPIERPVQDVEAELITRARRSPAKNKATRKRPKSSYKGGTRRTR